MQVDPGIWPAQSDPSQLETIILNLALNARDAMPNGGNLEISCANATDSEFTPNNNEPLDTTEFIRIAVADNGVGMTTETRRQAIDPFFTTKGVGEGSGLGLSMACGFVMQSGGHLEIESKEGVGTKITMFLPRSEELAAPARDDGSEVAMLGNGETVLVVEDDAEVRVFARRTLESLGYRVVEAKDVSNAQQILEGSQGVDLVLTDVILPGGTSGLEIARDLRHSRPELPVALMSGYSDIAAEEGKFAGQEFVLLNKPFQRPELAKTLRSVLNQSALSSRAS